MFILTLLVDIILTISWSTFMYVLTHNLFLSILIIYIFSLIVIIRFPLALLNSRNNLRKQLVGVLLICFNVFLLNIPRNYLDRWTDSFKTFILRSSGTVIGLLMNDIIIFLILYFIILPLISWSFKKISSFMISWWRMIRKKPISKDADDLPKDAVDIPII